MPVFRSCLCWHEVRTGSTAAGVLAITLSFLQILLQIAIWTANDSLQSALENSVYIVYIPLAAMDFLIIVFSVVLLIGVERDQKGRQMLVPWMVLACVYMLYEAGINIYFFVVSFPWAEELNKGVGLPGSMESPFERQANILTMLIVLVVYWLLKVSLYVLGVLCVLSRYQELDHYRRRYGRRALEHSYDVGFPRIRDYQRYAEPPGAAREYRVREPYREVREPYYGATHAPPRYPRDRQERARADYRTTMAPMGNAGGGGYLDPKRAEAYGGAIPYPGTPRLYPSTEHFRY